MPQHSPQRWQQVKSIVANALEIEPEERLAYLSSACADDTELRAQVENLLAHHEEDETFLEASPRDAVRNTVDGQRIGAYQITRELGHGGMGAVYLATRADDQYQKQVAIKLIRGVASEFLRQRFRAERQILANLDHPNIARMLDGGTTEDGSPYFVMEFIEGEPLDEYCDARQLSTIERLKLFLQVCSAVQYAHQNLVIHRDLKPGNILVTKDGMPRLLDFGIAKLLANNETIDANETATGMRLMTPAYASPEQVRGEAISTASDVYALGVILYELLTGHAPYDTRSKSLPELIKIVSEQEPSLPSQKSERGTRKTQGGKQETVAAHQTTQGKKRFAFIQSSDFRVPTSALRGDLDNIILMALRKEPSRRYASVEQFAADIRRHLDGLPVLAHKDTLSYRTTKFLKRNRLSVAATALILLAIMGGVTATIIQRNRAIKRFGKVRKLANAVIFDYQSAMETLPGATDLRARMIRDSLAYLDSLASEAGDDPALQSELGKAYERIGDIQGNTNHSNLNDTAAMLRSYQRSLELREAALRAEPNNQQWQSELAYAYEKMGQARGNQNDLKAALDYYEKARGIMTELAKTKVDKRRYLATIHQLIGDVLGFPGNQNLGDTKGARGHYQQAYEIAQSLFANDPKEYKNRWSIVSMSRSYANILNVTGETPKALEILHAAEKIAEEWVKDTPNDTRALDYLALTYDKLSDILEDQGDLSAALPYRRKHIEIYEKLTAVDAKDMRAARSLTLAYIDLGDLLAGMKDQAGSEQAYQRALKNNEQMATANPTNAELRTQLADAYGQFGFSLANANKTDEALRYIEKSLKMYEEMAAANPDNTRARLTIAENHIAIGELMSQKKQWSDALSAYQKALPVLEGFVQREPDNVVWPRGLADLHERHGIVYQEQKRWREAHDSYQRALAVWQGLKQRNVIRSKDEKNLESLPQKIKECEAALAR
ncbi:MAG: protein kinase [Acidobacteria bacterium]|nr:protein kinase [Acidobacteriota bacterium]